MTDWNKHTYFDLGIREQTGERETYHGTGWHTDGGKVHLCIGPNTSYVLTPENETTVYYDGRKAW